METKSVNLHGGMFIPEGRFDKPKFVEMLIHVLDIGGKFYPIVSGFLSGKIKKNDALKKIDNVWPK